MARATWNSGKSYFYFFMDANVAGDGKTVNWALYIHYSRMSVKGGSWSTNVNGAGYSGGLPAISSGSGSHETCVASGSTYVEHTGAVTIGFSFSCGFSWNIGGTRYNGASASGSLGLPSVAVAPTAPTSVSVSGGTNGYLSTKNPVCNVSWSGASRGTYTITTYNIDTTKNNFASIKTPYSANANNATSGSANNISFASLGLNGGEILKLRVAMMTTEGSWKLRNWSGSFKAYKPPSEPVLTSPNEVEIDTSFALTWTASTAGSLGLAGYDFQVRGYDGTSWSSWYSIYTSRNTTSYTAGTPKNLQINGVNYYETYGKNVKFQYRVRAYDGTVGYSDWVESNQISILIHQPTQPRK